MRFAALFTGLLFAIPTVLSAAVAGPAVASTNVLKRSAAANETDDALVPRQAAELAIAVATIISNILGQIGRDDAARGEFTQRTVAEGRAQWPEYNWVICHTDHSQFFDGNQGEQWDHFHREFDIQIGGTIGYEVYWFESGRFERHGDGGFLNWAYIGDVIRTENDGATVLFA